MNDFYTTLQGYLNIFLEIFNAFIFPHLGIIVGLVLFWVLFSRYQKKEPPKAYPSIAKELEREDVTIADLLATYLEAPAEATEVVEEAPEPVPETPAPAEIPTEVAAEPEIEVTPEAPKTKKTRRRKKRVTQRGSFIFNPKEAIIYNTILTRKY